MLTIGNVFALGESGTIDRSEPSKKRSEYRTVLISDGTAVIRRLGTAMRGPAWECDCATRGFAIGRGLGF